MSKVASYKMTGHQYRGRNVGRGCRKQSKIVKALRGLADCDLLDEVARDDAWRKRAREMQGATA